MEKIEILMSEHKEEFLKIVEDFYKEKYPLIKNNSINYKVITMNRSYENTTFTKTYIQVITDLSKIFSYKEFKPFFKRFVSNTKDNFSESCIRKNTIVKINDNLFVSVYSSNEKKINHLIDFFEHNQIKVTISPLD